MFSVISNISLKGLSVCVPKQIVKTMDYDWLSEDEREIFIKNTGTEERRVSNPKNVTSDFCERATNELLKKMNWDSESIDVLIFVSQSPDYYLPATSAILQHKLNFKKGIVAFDINLGCSGYNYGLYVISNLMTSGNLKRGILLTGDTSTLSTNFRDKSTYPLFGDAGAATALEYDANAEPMYFNMFTDGSGYKSIIVEDGGARNQFTETSFVEHKIEEGIYRSGKNLVLDGIEVFNFALKEVALSIDYLFKESKLTADDIDYFVFHQANKFINECVRKKCKVVPEKVPYSIQKFGNTSSASIPLTMIYKIKEELENKPLHLLLSGFGVGYSWGNTILTTNKIICTEIIEIE